MKVHQRQLRQSSRRCPTLRFNPRAWAKLLFLRDRGPTEIGGFGIASADELLCIEDFALIPQRCSPISVAFDDGAVADFFDAQVDLGRRPEQFGRVWLHTHPGHSPEPSRTDEQTFDRVFDGCDWAVMFILAQGGQTYARLRLNVGPGTEINLSTELDFERPFEATDFDAWDTEYHAKVIPELLVMPRPIEAVDAFGALSHDPNADPFADLTRLTNWW